MSEYKPDVDFVEEALQFCKALQRIPSNLQVESARILLSSGDVQAEVSFDDLNWVWRLDFGLSAEVQH